VQTLQEDSTRPERIADKNFGVSQLERLVKAASGKAAPASLFFASRQTPTQEQLGDALPPSGDIQKVPSATRTRSDAGKSGSGKTRSVEVKPFVHSMNCCCLFLLSLPKFVADSMAHSFQMFCLSFCMSRKSNLLLFFSFFHLLLTAFCCPQLVHRCFALPSRGDQALS
jgi:hypothetical protein